MPEARAPMEGCDVLPEAPLAGQEPFTRAFRELGAATFREACRIAHGLPYGHPSAPEEPLALFRERRGTCTTKHDAIAALARELDLPVRKRLGVYAMTESLVTGMSAVLERHGMPYLPMLHCFLTAGEHRVDLTAGNRNGKNGTIVEFLVTTEVPPHLGEREEYRWYRTTLQEVVLRRPEWQGIGIGQALRARAEGIALLRARAGEARSGPLASAQG